MKTRRARALDLAEALLAGRVTYPNWRTAMAALREAERASRSRPLTGTWRTW